MLQKNWKKVKLLQLLELLQQETDEQHPLPTNSICTKLEAMGLACDRRTLSKDIALLNEIGYEVMWKWVGKEKGYYVEDRKFSLPELKILMDAVQAAAFITDKKTAELLDKITALGGTHRADLLKQNMVQFNTRKHRNESIFYTVDALETALREKRKVIFRYFDLGMQGERIYRRNGHHYVVEPVALVFNEDNYYLSAYSARHKGTAVYRVDKMEGVEVLEEEASEKALEVRKHLGSVMEQTVHMFGGRPEDVVLRLKKNLLGAVYDRFGEDISVLPDDEEHLLASVHVRISPTFWGWLFQFAGDMEILIPHAAAKEFLQQASKILPKGE